MNPQHFLSFSWNRVRVRRLTGGAIIPGGKALGLVAVVCFLLAGVRPVWAQDGRISLEQAVTAALQGNPEIQLAVQRIAAARGERLQLEAPPQPEIEFSNEGIGYRKKAGEEGSEISLGIRQNVEFPGKRALRGRIGRLAEEQSALEAEKLRVLVRAAVKKAYYRIVLSDRRAAVLAKNSALLDSLIDSLLIQYQAGTGLYVDVLRARAEKARLQNRIIEEKQAGGTARLELNLLLGRPGNTPLQPTDDLPAPPQAGEAPAAVTPASPFTLRIADLRLRQSAAVVELARKGILPDLAVGLFAPSRRAAAWGFSLGLSVSLFAGKLQNGRMTVARAADETARIERRQAEQRVQSQMERAAAQVAAAQEQIRIYQEKLLQEMEDELTISIRHYQYGKIGFSALLDLYRACTEARVDHLQALYLYVSSLADLECAGESFGEQE